ncbi:MAG: hypothetical protein MUF48_18600 [Pirellulaceae bacterium]|jgi:hypothetical protein|nr:hypothetical protein [Pirellulaceae bacterium]
MDPAHGHAALADEDQAVAVESPRAAWESAAERDWGLHVERGPNWLFIRLIRCPDQPGQLGTLARCIADVLDQHLVNRVVLELNEAACPCERLVVELQQLDAWMQTHHGVLRVCGVPAHYVRRLRRTHFTDRFPLYQDREEAVWGGTRFDRPPR